MSAIVSWINDEQVRTVQQYYQTPFLPPPQFTPSISM